MENGQATSQVMIHVRFAPDGAVTEISERPTTVSAQDWFNRLSDQAGMHYQPLSGGRGLFRLNPDEVKALKAAATH